MKKRSTFEETSNLERFFSILLCHHAGFSHRLYQSFQFCLTLYQSVLTLFVWDCILVGQHGFI